MQGTNLERWQAFVEQDRPHVVILGGGFAGLQAARALRRSPVRVTLIDRHNYHLFQPLLYQVATGALGDAEVAMPLRTILRRQSNVQVLMATATRIVPEERCVILDHGSIDYDYLIVATGATFSYFGHDEWAETAPGLKSIEDAINIRRRVFCAFEAAEREQDPRAQEAFLTFVIVGAGPTGVELAGTLSEIAKRTLAKDFRRIDPRTARVVIVDATPTVLPMYPAKLQDKARAQLRDLGVEVISNFHVNRITDQGVGSVDGQWIAARTVLWAAGVKATPLTQDLGAKLDRAGRVHVDADLSVPGHREIFVVGDLAHVEQDGQLVPGLAPAAMQMGRHAADCIERDLDSRERQAFSYSDKGSFAVIGRGAAVGQIAGRWNMSGMLAWLAWLFIHIIYLVGFRNRLVTLFNWAYSYLTYRRGARLITGTAGELRVSEAKVQPAHASIGTGQAGPAGQAGQAGQPMRPAAAL